ncbi:hypothetical protein QJS10_CPA06g02035 [Acorus calamus]|uniref:Uncharacterized protein n=1 Tax=Acorus calamus TaxID=4465 RepID=A0AAV9ENR4_ACOCL|nr:hypothetical protein QJS10_CPA06g02035 [Acorus calamus]
MAQRECQVGDAWRSSNGPNRIGLSKMNWAEHEWMVQKDRTCRSLTVMALQCVIGSISTLKLMLGMAKGLLVGSK